MSKRSVAVHWVRCEHCGHHISAKSDDAVVRAMVEHCDAKHPFVLAVVQEAVTTPDA